MNKFYKRFLILIVLVLVISGTVIYTTVDINTLKNLTQFKTWSIALEKGCSMTGPEDPGIERLNVLK